MRMALHAAAAASLVWPMAAIVFIDDATHVGPDGMLKVDWVVAWLIGILGLTVSAFVCFFLAREAAASRNSTRRLRLALYTGGIVCAVASNLVTFQLGRLDGVSRLFLIIMYAGVAMMCVAMEMGASSVHPRVFLLAAFFVLLFLVLLFVSRP